MYSIGIFAKKVSLTPDTLRYYEKEKLLLPKRQGSKRMYDEADVTWVMFIKRLKDTGMPIKQIATYASLRAAGAATVRQRLDMLREHRKSVIVKKMRIEKNLEALDVKIGVYERNLNEVR